MTNLANKAIYNNGIGTDKHTESRVTTITSKIGAELAYKLTAERALSSSFMMMTMMMITEDTAVCTARIKQVCVDVRSEDRDFLDINGQYH